MLRGTRRCHVAVGPSRRWIQVCGGAMDCKEPGTRQGAGPPFPPNSDTASTALRLIGLSGQRSRGGGKNWGIEGDPRSTGRQQEQPRWDRGQFPLPSFPSYLVYTVAREPANRAGLEADWKLLAMPLLSIPLARSEQCTLRRILTLRVTECLINSGDFLSLESFY